jgi:SPX domain protein involved in polyphosphate accumulation
MSGRYEYKYVFQSKYLNYVKIYLKLNHLNFSKQYNKRHVNSLYYDNFDRDLYNYNLFGISKRKKYRLRWYGDIYGIHNVFFEIKKKENDLGFKKISKINKFDINNHTKLSYISKKINEKINLIDDKEFSLYNKPVVLTRYLREYYINWNKNVRITIDSNLVGYDLTYQKNLTFKTKRSLLNQNVLEIKFEESAINEVEFFLKDFLILRTKNSKYINFVDMLNK